MNCSISARPDFDAVLEKLGACSPFTWAQLAEKAIEDLTKHEKTLIFVTCYGKKALFP